MSHITSTGNDFNSSLRDFFTRKKKLTAAASAAQGQSSAPSQELSNRLSSPPVFTTPTDSIDVKPKSIKESNSKEFGSLLNGLEDAYGDPKDPKHPKAEKGEDIKGKDLVQSKKFSKDKDACKAKIAPKDACKAKAKTVPVAKKVKPLQTSVKK